MNIDTTSTFPPMLAATMTHEAAAAQHAITAESKEENARQITEISDGADANHVAEHIRGLVAVTMGHLSINATAIAGNNAERWQQWALAVADGIERGAPAVV